MKWVGFDLEVREYLEGHALQPWRVRTGTAAIRSVGTCQPNGVRWTELDPTVKSLETLLLMAATEEVTYVGWNLVYDLAVMVAAGIDVSNVRWIDGMLIWKRVEAQRFTYGLKAAIKLHMPEIVGYDEGVDFNTDDPAELARLLWYNGIDAAAALWLTKFFWAQLSTCEQKAALIEAKSLPRVAASWEQGICLNTERLDTAAETLTVELTETLHKLEAVCTPDVIKSPKKLSVLLYEDMGLTPIRYTDAKVPQPSTDKEALIKLAVDHPEVDLIRRARNAGNSLSKYVTATRASIELNECPVTHPEPKVAGTYTGRFTYASSQGKGKKKQQTGIALHQWPRRKTERQMIVPPEGYLLGEADWAGQEMRLMAAAVYEVCGDDTMLKLFLDGMDAHASMGADISHRPYDWVVENKDGEAKPIRYLGKFSNLSLQFRIGIATMRVRALTQYDLWLNVGEAEHIKATYLNKYWGVREFWQWAINTAGRQGYVSTYGHRRVKLDDLRDWGQQQTAINTRIQGTGADMKQLGIAMTDGFMRDTGIVYGFDLHDALFVYVPDDRYAEGNMREFRSILGNLPYHSAWGWEPPLPLPVDASLGTSWGDLKELT